MVFSSFDVFPALDSGAMRTFFRGKILPQKSKVASLIELNNLESNSVEKMKRKSFLCRLPAQVLIH